MFQSIDQALINVIKKDLTIKIPENNIFTGCLSSKYPSISLLMTEFTLEDIGIGGSKSIRYERNSDSFNGDGITTEFQLKDLPLQPLISLECPAGSIKSESDDFTIDYTTGTITMRKAPEKKNNILMVAYNRATSIGEILTLLIKAEYVISIRSKDYDERDNLTRHIITTLAINESRLSDQGITAVKFIEGYTKADNEEKQVDEMIMEYLVEAALNLEIPGAPMERVVIGKKGK